jgi:ABC-2 type transport system permease protein
MSDVLTIFKREFRSYFDSPIAYIFLTVFLLVANWFFFINFFDANEASLRGLFGMLPILFLLFVPAVTMRSWAEERKLGTFELLMTLPVKDHHAVLGKFLAGFVFMGLAVVLTFPLVITISYLGDPDPGPIWGGYLGSLLLAGAYVSIGVFMSSLSENQIVAFIMAMTVCLVLYLVGTPIVTARLPGWLATFLGQLSLASHFDSIGRGVIDSRDVLYYLSIIAFFLFLNVRVIESRTWR